MKHPGKFAELTRSIDAKRAEKDAAEMRWLEVVDLAEALGQ
jgi:ATP-binding cassette subfamily F protein uup